MSISGPPWVVELSAGGIPRWSADATALLKPDGTVAGHALSLSAEQVTAVAGLLTGPKSPGTVAINWNDCTISGVTANWSVSKSTDVLYAGLPTLEISSGSGAATTLMATITLPEAVFLGSAKRLHFCVRPGDRALTGDSTQYAQIWLKYSASTTHRVMSYAGTGAADEQWATGTLYDQEAPGTGHITGTAQWAKVDAEAITAVTLVVTSSGDVTEPLYLSCFFTDQITPPTLTLFMDGQYSGQYNYARHALQAANLRASMAIAGPWITAPPGGTMTAAQVSKMYEHGHEAIHHTGAGAMVGWDDLTKYPDGSEYALVKADIEASWAMFRAYGWTRGIGYGVVGNTNGMVKTQTLTRRRNIRNAVMDAGLSRVRVLGATIATFDSHFEHASSPATFLTPSLLATSTTTSGDIDSYVNALVTRGGWGGITFHDFVLSGAAGTNMNIATLDAALVNIIDKVNHGVLRVLPMSEAMQAIPLPDLVAP
jgi:hypothetical protein